MSSRPMFLMDPNDLAAAARAAAAAAACQSSAGFPHSSSLTPSISTLPGSPFAPQYSSSNLTGLQLAKYPEVGLFSQLGQLFPKGASTEANSIINPSEPAGASTPPARKTPTAGRPRSSPDSKNTYASRHQAAEQRRRMRINDRMERLRTIVPHAERANTAAFLEEVINHILSLEQRLRELDQTAAEKKQGKEVTGTVDFQVEFDSKKRRGEIIRTSVSPVAKRSA